VIDPAAILVYDFGQPAQAYSPRDAILHAPGAGLGGDPIDTADLAFLDEQALSVLPTFAVKLCAPGMWIRDPALGVDFGKLVHAAQPAEFLAPLPFEACACGEAQVISLTDRGEGKGAVPVLERRIFDAASGELEFQIWRGAGAAARFAAYVGTRKLLDQGEIAWRDA